MDFMTVANQMLSLACIMLIGYIMYKAHIIDKTATERFSKLVLNITMPAQILLTFVENRGVVSNGEVLGVFGISALCFLFYFVMTLVFVRLMRTPQKDRGPYYFMSSFGNVGFMGFPVITSIFGESAMIYAVIYNVVFNLCVYSYGLLWMGGAEKQHGFNPKLLLNMPFMSSLVSILLFFTGIPLPEIVTKSFGYLGDVTTPVAMLILGATIGAMPLKELFDEWRIYLFTAFRLGVLPLTVILIFRLLPVGTPMVRNVMVILSGMPAATNATMLAIEYHGNVQLVSKGIFFTTILSVVTIPLIAMLCA